MEFPQFWGNIWIMSYQELRDELVKNGVNLSREILSVQDIEGLDKLFRKYYIWTADIKDFINKLSALSDTKQLLFFVGDKGFSYRMTRGIGVIFGDKQSTQLVESIGSEIEKKISLLSQITDQVLKKSTDKRIELFLEEGILWRKPRDKRFYRLKRVSGRLSILTYLIKNKGWHTTKSIVANLLPDRSKKSIVNAIQMINDLSREKLGLKNEKLIIGEKGYGYRLNGKYSVTTK